MRHSGINPAIPLAALVNYLILHGRWWELNWHERIT